MKIIQLILLFLCCKGISQVKQFAITQGGIEMYKGNLYAFGLVQLKTESQLRIYIINKDLTAADSLSIGLGKIPASDFLPPYSDSLHERLNLYLHQKSKPSVSVFRISAGLTVESQAAKIEPARLNNRQLFSSDPLYCHGSVFNVRAVPDSNGRQFYIQRHDLKSPGENYDYRMSWQYPLERKHIEQVYLFSASPADLYAFVNVGAGVKAGEWVLRIDAKKGTLICAGKLNEKTELQHYAYGNFIADTVKRELLLFGQKYGNEQAQGKTAVVPRFYLVNLDSGCTVTEREEIKLILPVKTGSARKAAVREPLLKPVTLKRGAGALFAECDMYEVESSVGCYRYSGTFSLMISKKEESYQLSGTPQTHTLIEQFYGAADRLDLNGKICADSLPSMAALYIKSPGLQVKHSFRSSGEKAGSLLLSKNNTRKKTVSYAVLLPDKKGWRLQQIGEFKKEVRPAMKLLLENQYVIGKEIENGNYELRIGEW